MPHKINSAGDCECGSDGCTCQICAQRVCGTQAHWSIPVPGTQRDGNVCFDCLRLKRKLVELLPDPHTLAIALSLVRTHRAEQ